MSQRATDRAEEAERLTAYSITLTKNDGAIWARCGIAFRNPDGSITVKLDTLPLSGRIHLRNPHADKQLAQAMTRHHDSSQQHDPAPPAASEVAS